MVLASLVVVAVLAGCDGENNDPMDTDNGNPAGFLYVANQSDNTVFVYDTRTMIRVDSFLSVVEQPHCVETSHDHQYLYIVGRTSPGQLAKFELATNTFVDSAIAPDDLFPTMVMVSMDGSTGYVCDFTDPSKPGKIHRYNLNTMTFVDSSLSAGSATHDVRMTTDGMVLVAANFGTDNLTIVYTDGDTVTFVDLDATNPAPAGTPRLGPYGVAIDPNDSLAYIACRLSHEVRVVDLHTREVVDSIVIPIEGTGSLYGPSLMTISPDGRFLYVTTQLENTVAVLDLTNRSVITQVELGVPRPFGIAGSSDGSRYYVACVNSENPGADRTGRVYVIDGATHTVVDSVSVGNNSWGLGWVPADPGGHH